MAASPMIMNRGAGGAKASQRGGANPNIRNSILRTIAFLRVASPSPRFSARYEVDVQGISFSAFAFCIACVLRLTSSF